MLHRFESRPRRAAHPQCRRISGYQFRMRLLQLRQFAHQPVIRRIRNLRVILHVIFVLVVTQLFAQLGNLFLDGGGRGSGFGHVGGPREI